MPRRNAPAPHGGHFDPGQRVMNVALVVSLLALTVSGILMSFPERITPAAFAVSLRAHRASTIVLVIVLAGHVLVASGILPAYRGVWRAMHGDGRVSGELAGRLWPSWTAARESEERELDGE
jgi:formate dehydrogenase subunit gamma